MSFIVCFISSSLSASLDQSHRFITTINIIIINNYNNNNNSKIVAVGCKNLTTKSDKKRKFFRGQKTGLFEQDLKRKRLIIAMLDAIN